MRKIAAGVMEQGWLVGIFSIAANTNNGAQAQKEIPTMADVRALIAAERLNELYQNITDWVLSYHYQDTKFCEVLEKLHEATELASSNLMAAIYPFREEDYEAMMKQPASQVVAAKLKRRSRKRKRDK